MAYNITKSNGTSVITVADGSVNSSPSLDVGLVGRNTTGYGETIAETQVHLLENFAGSTAPPNAIQGQLWFDTTVDEGLKVNVATSNDGGGSPAPSWSSLAVIDESGILFVDQIGTQANPVNDIYGGTFHGVATQAQYADLAERYEADRPYEPGTLVALGGDAEITCTTSTYDENVFGVISTQPGLMLNAYAGDDKTHPYVAMSGRVPVMLVGPAKKGQRIVSSDMPGVAMAVNNNSSSMTPFNVIGRVLEDKMNNGIGLVLAVVGAK